MPVSQFFLQSEFFFEMHLMSPQCLTIAVKAAAELICRLIVSCRVLAAPASLGPAPQTTLRAWRGGGGTIFLVAAQNRILFWQPRPVCLRRYKTFKQTRRGGETVKQVVVKQTSFGLPTFISFIFILLFFCCIVAF